MLYQNPHFPTFPMKFCFKFLNYFRYLILEKYHWSAGFLKPLLLRMRFGNQNAIVSFDVSCFAASFHCQSLWNTVSHRLISKAFKQIYMDWIYEKYLRDRSTRNSTFFKSWCRGFTSIRGCCFDRPWYLSDYPIRPIHESQVSAMVGFNHHPDSSQDM